MIITSKSNDKIKYINKLKNKKYRDKFGKYILEGIKLVDEYISSEGSNSPEFIVVCKEILSKNQGGEEVYNKVKDLNNIIEVDEATFNYLTDTTSPQGILITIPKRDNEFEDIITKINNNEQFVILDKVQDAGNIGTIIRTCASFNIKNMICIKGSVDIYSSKVVRSAMGAINKVNIYYLDIKMLLNLKKYLLENGYIIIGTSLKAKKYLHELTPNKKMIYVVGNEANGISEEMKDICDGFVKIKMEEIQESLNVGVATSILLYDMYIRRKISE